MATRIAKTASKNKLKFLKAFFFLNFSKNFRITINYEKNNSRFDSLRKVLLYFYSFLFNYDNQIFVNKIFSTVNFFNIIIFKLNNINQTSSYSLALYY